VFVWLSVCVKVLCVGVGVGGGRRRRDGARWCGRGRGRKSIKYFLTCHKRKVAQAAAAEVRGGSSKATTSQGAVAATHCDT